MGSGAMKGETGRGKDGGSGSARRAMGGEAAVVPGGFGAAFGSMRRTGAGVASRSVAGRSHDGARITTASVRPSGIRRDIAQLRAGTIAPRPLQPRGLWVPCFRGRIPKTNGPFRPCHESMTSLGGRHAFAAGSARPCRCRLGRESMAPRSFGLVGRRAATVTAPTNQRLPEPDLLLEELPEAVE